DPWRQSRANRCPRWLAGRESPWLLQHCRRRGPRQLSRANGADRVGRPGSYAVLKYYCANRVSKSILIHEMPQATPDESSDSRPNQDQIDEESRRIRRLRILVQLTIESIAAGDLTPEEAAGRIAPTRRVVFEMFPGKERAFALLYRPKFQRVMHAVYRLQ